MNILRNIVVILFLFLIVGLGIRTLVTADHRYGWGMFATQTNYELKYRLRYKQESRSYIPRKELRGKTKRRLSPRRRTISRYGIGAVRRWVGNYTCYIYEKNNSDELLYAEAVIRYYTNRQNPAVETVICPQLNSPGES